MFSTSCNNSKRVVTIEGRRREERNQSAKRTCTTAEGACTSEDGGNEAVQQQKEATNAWSSSVVYPQQLGDVMAGGFMKRRVGKSHCGGETELRCSKTTGREKLHRQSSRCREEERGSRWSLVTSSAPQRHAESQPRKPRPHGHSLD